MMRTTTLAILMALLAPAGAMAHHILGIPHYKYDENYPQIPFVEILAQSGPHDLTFTYFPGFPKPDEAVRFKLYIRNRESGQPFLEPLHVEVTQRRFLRDSVAVVKPFEIHPGEGPEKNDYKFYVTFPEAEAYEVRVAFPAVNGVEVIPFPVTIGQTDDRPLIFGAAGILGFAVVSVAFIKRRRRRRSGSRRTT